MDIGWIVSKKGQNFVTLCKSFSGLPNSFYESEFITYLLEAFWDQTKTELFWK